MTGMTEQGMPRRGMVIDRRVACDFCGKEKKESAMIYIVRQGKDGKYMCNQKCADLANKLILPHLERRV